MLRIRDYLAGGLFGILTAFGILLMWAGPPLLLLYLGVKIVKWVWYNG